MLVAERAQAREIALRRNQNAGRPRHGLNDNRRDRGGVVERDETLEIVGKLRAMLRNTARKCVSRQIVSVPNVIDASEKRTKGLAVPRYAANCDAADARPMIAPFATDQPNPGVFATNLMIGKSCLERGVDCLRPGVRKEDVVHPNGREIGAAPSKFKRLRMSHLKGRRIVQLFDLSLNGLNDSWTGMASIAAPEASRSIENNATVTCPVMHVLG